MTRLPIRSGSDGLGPVPAIPTDRRYTRAHPHAPDNLATAAAGTRRAQRQVWWQAAAPDAPDQLSRLCALEQLAKGLTQWHPTRIPGLLQTAEYARAVITAASPGASGREIGQDVRVRMERAKRFRPGSRQALFLIDEAALLRPVGGPGVMALQLAHLLDLPAERDDLEVRIVPLTSAVSVPLHISLYRLDLEECVFLEQLDGAVYTTDRTAIRPYAYALARLEDQALDAAASRALLRERWEGMCREIDRHGGGRPATPTSSTASRSQASPESSA